jgi:hypothetical protein
MEWVGGRVFERGCSKSGDEKSKGVEVLDASEGEEVTDRIIEDEDDEDEGAASSGGSGGETVKRWTRIVSCAVGIAQAVEGFRRAEGTRDWRIEGVLGQKVHRLKERLKRSTDGGSRLTRTLLATCQKKVRMMKMTQSKLRN